MNSRTRRGNPRRVLPTSPFRQGPEEVGPPEIYAVGDRINHDRYGLGSVVGAEGTAAVIVNFGTETRRISVPNPKLIRI